MRVPVVLVNLVSMALTMLVVAGDGPPTKPAYVALGAMLLLVPALTIFALVRGGAGRAWLSKGPVGGAAPGGGALARAAAVLNMLLVAFIGWAIVDQHPHPREEGYVAYVVLMIAAPTVSAAALLWSVRRSDGGAER